MPLYKKTGYFWAPESSVYMENYLPGIFRRKLFQSYIEKFSWYETFKRALDLAPDVELIDGMSVYNYYFEADEDNSLKVVIDTKAKKIAGFELKSPEGKIGINCLIKNSVGFVAFGKVPVSWTFLNETENDITFTLKANCLNGIKFETEPERQIIVKSGKTTIIQAFAILDETVTPLANPKESQTRVKPRIESIIHFNEEEIDLAVGLAPVDPLEIELYPHLRSIIPGEKSTINLRAWNRTFSKIKGSIVLSENPNIGFESNKIPILLNANERKDITLSFTALENISEKNIPLKLNVFIDEKDGSVKLPEETIYLPIIDPLGLELNCTGYYLKNKYAILENNNLRLKFILADAYLFDSITDKRNNRVYRLRTSLLDLGMPFTGWGSELGRLSQEVKIIQGIGKVTLELLVKSKVKDGIHIKRSFTLRTNSDLIEASVKAINTSNKTFKNIGVRVLFDGWDKLDTEGTTYFPVSKGILRSSNTLVFKSARHFPEKAQEFSETWIGAELSNNQLLGFIWHKEFVTKIETRSLTVPQLEFQFGDIAPGESKEGKNFIFMGRGSWTDIRKIWKDTVEKKSSTSISTNNQRHIIFDELTVDVESETFGKTTYFDVLPLNFDDVLKLTVNNNTHRKLKGKIQLCLPKGLTFENGSHLYEEEVDELSDEKPYLCTQ
ncbi:MAG: COG1470 family protein, partial [Candidatus Heimdallarchaeota archaeon]